MGRREKKKDRTFLDFLSRGTLTENLGEFPFECGQRRRIPCVLGSFSVHFPIGITSRSGPGRSGINDAGGYSGEISWRGSPGRRLRFLPWEKGRKGARKKARVLRETGGGCGDEMGWWLGLIWWRRKMLPSPLFLLLRPSEVLRPFPLCFLLPAFLFIIFGIRDAKWPKRPFDYAIPAILNPELFYLVAYPAGMSSIRVSWLQRL